MNLKEKINYLSSNLAVSEKELYDAVLLNFPDEIDLDLYLAIQATLISATKVSSKEVLNLIRTTVMRLKCDYNDILNMVSFKSFDDAVEKFGKYQLSKGIALAKESENIKDLVARIA